MTVNGIKYRCGRSVSLIRKREVSLPYNSCGYTTPRLGVFPRLMISAWCRLGVPRVSDYPKRRGYTPNKLPKANKLKHFHLAGNG